MKKRIVLFLLLLTSIAIHAAPNRTTDLSLTADPADGTQLHASWTTPTPDSGCSLTSYDVRISSRSVGSRTWRRATEISGEPSVDATGTTVNMVLTGLTKGTRYYVGLQTTDTCGTSRTSNSPYEVTTRTVEPQFKSVTISWTMPTDWYSPANNLYYRLDGAKVHVGTTPGGPYDFDVTDVGYTDWHTLSGFPDDGTEYYLVLTGYGYNLETNQPYESDYSNELSF